jgi:hypothetical protein
MHQLQVTPAINLAQSHIPITDRPQLTDGQRTYCEYLVFRFPDGFLSIRWARYMLSGFIDPRDTELLDYMADMYEDLGSSDPADVLFYLEQCGLPEAAGMPWPED